MRKLLLSLVLCLLCLGLATAQEEQTPYEIALQRIEEARVSGAASLNLALLGLAELPPEIGNLTNLRQLWLFDNQLSYLPSSIAGLVNLLELDLRYNQLQSLPSEIGSLRNLRELLLTSNELESLPSEFANLSNLRFLSLSGNNLNSLPNEFVSLPELCWLDISYNQFRELPTLLGEMEKLSENCVGMTRHVHGQLMVDYNPLISPPLK